MITMIAGLPGSGKTYFAVFKALELIERGWIVYHNIEGFQAGNYFEVDENFSEERIRALDRGAGKCLIIIDECQRFFGSGIRTPPSSMYALQYHRHLGVDIWLILQTKWFFSSGFMSLVERYYEARPTSRIFFGRDSFHYWERSPFKWAVVLRRFKLKRLQAVFSKYDSAELMNDNERSFGSAYFRTGLVFAFGLCVLSVSATLFYFSFFAKVVDDNPVIDGVASVIDDSDSVIEGNKCVVGFRLGFEPTGCGGVFHLK